MVIFYFFYFYVLQDDSFSCIYRKIFVWTENMAVKLFSATDGLIAYNLILIESV